MDAPQVEPNDPTETGAEAELTDEQRAQAEAEPTQGDQGPQVQEQDATAVGAATGGFDPNEPSRISPPAPDAQSGVPGIPENADVESGDGGPVVTETEGGTAVTDETDETDETAERSGY